MKLVLFDIDGTILYCGKAGRKSLDKAIKKVCGTNGIPDGYSLGGKTDQQIIYEVLSSENFSKNEINSKIKMIFDEYYNILDFSLKNDGLDKKIMPGIIPLLDKLYILKNDVVLGLITGNLINTAYLKLNVFNLQNYFMKENSLFGGFGSDHHERSKVLESAVARGNKYANYTFKEKEIVVIGDTHNDILCGKHLNVKSIAVATGEWKYDQLKVHEPDYVYDDFSDYQTVFNNIMD